MGVKGVRAGLGFRGIQGIRGEGVKGVRRAMGVKGLK